MGGSLFLRGFLLASLLLFSLVVRVSPLLPPPLTSCVRVATPLLGSIPAAPQPPTNCSRDGPQGVGTTLDPVGGVAVGGVLYVAEALGAVRAVDTSSGFASTFTGACNASTAKDVDGSRSKARFVEIAALATCGVAATRTLYVLGGEQRRGPYPTRLRQVGRGGVGRLPAGTAESIAGGLLHASVDPPPKDGAAPPPPGGRGTDTGFLNPRGLACGTLDSFFTLFVGEPACVRSFAVVSSESWALVAGNCSLDGSAPVDRADGMGSAARFDALSSIAAGGWGGGSPYDDFLFVTEGGSHTVRSVHTPSRAVVTLAGYTGPDRAESTGFVDGVGTAARFSNPQGCVFDPATDTLLVADAGNHVVRGVDPVSATVWTLVGVGAFPLAGAPGDAFPLGLALLPARGTFAVMDRTAVWRVECTAPSPSLSPTPSQTPSAESTPSPTPSPDAPSLDATRDATPSAAATPSASLAATPLGGGALGAGAGSSGGGAAASPAASVVPGAVAGGVLVGAAALGAAGVWLSRARAAERRPRVKVAPPAASPAATLAATGMVYNPLGTRGQARAACVGGDAPPPSFVVNPPPPPAPAPLPLVGALPVEAKQDSSSSSIISLVLPQGLPVLAQQESRSVPRMKGGAAASALESL